MLSGLAFLIFCHALWVLLLWVRRLWYQLRKTERKGRYNQVYIYTWGLSKIGYIRKNSIWAMAKFELRGVMHFLFKKKEKKKGCFRLAIQVCTKVNPTCISFFVMNFHLNMIYIYIYIYIHTHIVFVGEWGEQRWKVLRGVL